MATESNNPTSDFNGDPLRLSPFERYMICDERLDCYSMCVPIRWTVQGKPQREPFRIAFREAILWHPMLHSLVDRKVWRINHKAIAEVKIFSDGETPTAADRKVDVFKGPTIRCNVVEQGEETSIEFMFHHAATDGVSFMEFCGDVFANYAVAIGKLDRTKLRRPHQKYLSRRAEVDRAIPEPVDRMTAFRFTAMESLRFFTRRAEMVAGDIARDSRQRVQCGDIRILDAPFDMAQSSQVRAAANEAEVSLNDWAILSLLRVIAKWNDQHLVGSRRSWLVANMPVLLRPRQAVRMSAANMIGYGFLSRQRDAIDDWDSALQTVAEHSRFIQRWKIGAMFLDGVAMADRIPGGLYAATRATRPASCVVTNLGDVPRRFRTKLPLNEDGLTIAGDLTLKRISGAAPLRPGTHVTTLINTTGGRINLSLRVMPEILSQQAAFQLVARWKEEMMVHS
ncbi:hypothetical protein [Novipirellula aureliae]|nr:hypothetical protein [Novipirellula aureliae]